MSRTFLIGDTHFGHKNIITFKRGDGSPLRPFKTIEEQDETLIDNWNKTVRPGDKVYHLGDVGLHNATSFGSVMSRLHGEKILIKGNHDQLKLVAYAEHFKDVRSYHMLDRIILAHVPLHPSSLSRFKGQIHGHTHWWCLDDPMYYNVSCECINYTPIDFEIIRSHFTNLYGSDTMNSRQLELDFNDN